MPGRRKQPTPKVRPHYEDDELRLHVAAYLCALPDDHPAVECWNRDRSTIEVERAFPTEAESAAFWAVIRPRFNEWEARCRELPPVTTGIWKMHE